MMMFDYSRVTQNDAHIPWHRQGQKGSQGSWAWGLGKKFPKVLLLRHHKENLPSPSGEWLRSQSSNCLSLSKWEVIEIKFLCQLNNEEFHGKLMLCLPGIDLCMFFRSFAIFSGVLLLTSTPCTLCISTFFSLKEFLYKKLLVDCLLLRNAPSLPPSPHPLKENVVQAHSGILFSHCREGNPAICHSMARPGGH